MKITFDRTPVPTDPYSVFASVHGSIGQENSTALAKSFYPLYEDSKRQLPEKAYFIVKFKGWGINNDRVAELKLAQSKGAKIIIQTSGKDSKRDWNGFTAAAAIEYVRNLSRQGINIYGACMGNEPESPKWGLHPKVWADQVALFHSNLRFEFPNIKHVLGSFASWPGAMIPAEALAKYYPDVAQEMDICMIHLYGGNPLLAIKHNLPGRIRKALGNNTIEFFNGETSKGFVNHPPGMVRFPENERACFELHNRLTGVYGGWNIASFNIQDEDWQKSRQLPGTNKENYYPTPQFYDAEGMWDREGGIRLTGAVHRDILSKVKGQMMNFTREIGLPNSIQAAAFVDGSKTYLIVVNCPPENVESEIDITEIYITGIKHAEAYFPVTSYTPPDEAIVNAILATQTAELSLVVSGNTVVSLPQLKGRMLVASHFVDGVNKVSINMATKMVTCPPYSLGLFELD